MTSHAIDYLQVSRYITDIDSFAKSRGIRLAIKNDFDELRDLCKRLPGKPVPFAPFNPDYTDVGPHNAFWIEGRNGGGDVVHVQAVRCDDLSDTTLANQIHSLLEPYATQEVLETTEDLDFCQSPTARTISGKVCYHGEIWLRGGSNGYRGTGLSGILPRLILALSLAKWAPDFIWGFGHAWLVERGIPQKYGYHNIEPRGAYMETSKLSRPINSWIMWLSQSDLIELTHDERQTDLAVGMGY
ncbi:hypothetical protein [Pelagibius sp. Alg239-R121]|uniref:hypothetical protein n=1 Tax=Pelagibius sp. Alg239-R121 TaxID=2993448 RepID=UPI0024A6C2CB|nr:hypothetical protein [Pelagibius sp. Alg239-R121]